MGLGMLISFVLLGLLGNLQSGNTILAVIGATLIPLGITSRRRIKKRVPELIERIRRRGEFRPGPHMLIYESEIEELERVAPQGWGESIRSGESQ
jgi:hypothetical protein